jgi:Zn-dependent M28 family amino/carboxypeptidase
MHSAPLVLMLLAAEFSGSSALEYARKAVAFGPRPAGSPAMKKQQQWILGELKMRRCQVIEDDFIAHTPLGDKPMKNIIARFAGTSGRAIAVTGHYDTKPMPGITFVGANDGGSSTGFLLEMARVLSGAPRKDDVYLVWFDGEEAFAQWSETDSLYGSRHLAERWRGDGTLGRLRGLINVDMIGDKDLGILTELNSSPGLYRLVWQTAAEIGYRKHFLTERIATEDDHIPFLRQGVEALDLIDFQYGPDNQYWHSEKDTMDKLSPASLEAVGRVLVEVVRKLEARR